MGLARMDPLKKRVIIGVSVSTIGVPVHFYGPVWSLKYCKIGLTRSRRKVLSWFVTSSCDREHLEVRDRFEWHGKKLVCSGFTLLDGWTVFDGHRI